MGSVDEGWSHDQGSAEISVELDDVALETLASSDPCLMPCVDCGLVTKYFCDLCRGEDHFPQDKWAHGQPIPLCSRCDLTYWQCHFCRGVHWCVPAPHKYMPLSVALHHTFLPLQDRLSEDEKKLLQNRVKELVKEEKKLLQNRVKEPLPTLEKKWVEELLPTLEKKWDDDLQEYVYLTRVSTENARPSSSSTVAASGDLHTVRGRGMCRDTCERSQTD